MTRRFEDPEQVPVTFLELFDMFARNSKAGRLTLRDLVGGRTKQELLDDSYETPDGMGLGFYKYVWLQDRSWRGWPIGCELKRYFFYDDTESSDGVGFAYGPKLIPVLAHHLRRNGPFTMTLWGWRGLWPPDLLELDGRLHVYINVDSGNNNNYVIGALLPGGEAERRHCEHITLASPVMSEAIKQVAFQRFVAFLHRSGLRLA